MLNYRVIYSLSERESGSKHVRNSVYLSRIEKGFNNNQELVSHSMPVYIEALSKFSHKITPAALPRQLLTM